jgi:hypothetical protein
MTFFVGPFIFSLSLRVPTVAIAGLSLQLRREVRSSRVPSSLREGKQVPTASTNVATNVATNLAFAFGAGKLLALPDGKLPPLKGGLEAVGRASSTK